MGMQAATDGRISYIENALKMGFAPAAISRGLGITESAVSQLIDTYKISGASVSKKAAELDGIYDNLELMTAQKLGRALAVCELDPVRLSVVLSRVNGLRRRSQGENINGGVGSGQAALVNLNLPANFGTSVQVTVSPLNQVIEIEGRTVATLDRSKLHTLKNVDINNLFAPSTPQVYDGAPASLPASTLLELGAEQTRQSAHIGVIEHDGTSTSKTV